MHPNANLSCFVVHIMDGFSGLMEAIAFDLLLLGCLVAWSLGRLVVWLFVWSFGRLVDWLFGRLVDWSLGRLIAWLFGLLVAWSPGRLSSCFVFFLFFALQMCRAAAAAVVSYCQYYC